MKQTLNDFVSHYCHRRLSGHWAMDKTVRDAGPFFATLGEGVWTGSCSRDQLPAIPSYLVLA